MNLTITNENLQIKLTFLEQFLAFRFRKNLEIPLAHIKQVTTATQSSWKDLRSAWNFYSKSYWRRYFLDRQRQRVLVCK